MRGGIAGVPRAKGEYDSASPRRICDGGAGPGSGRPLMLVWGGGVGDGRVGVLVTSLTRLGGGGGSSSLRRDMMLRPPLRGSGGRGGAAAGVWTGVPD